AARGSGGVCLGGGGGWGWWGWRGCVWGGGVGEGLGVGGGKGGQQDAGCGKREDPAEVRWNDVAGANPMSGGGVRPSRVRDGAGAGAEVAHAGAPRDPPAALQPAHRGGVRGVGAPVRAVCGVASSVGAGRAGGGAVPVESGRGGGQRDDAEPGRERAAVLV